MKREQMRIALAKAMGLIKGDVGYYRNGVTTILALDEAMEGNDHWKKHQPKEGENIVTCLPSTLPDITLDWMHECEQEFKNQPLNHYWYPYCKLLHQMTNGLGEGATKEQRCEAWLRIKNLWKDSPK